MKGGGTTPPPAQGDTPSIASEVDRLLFWILEHKAEKRYEAFRQACDEHPDLAQSVEKRYRFMFAAQIVADFEDPEPGQIHTYHILRKLGQGGMGAVYEAEQQEPLQRKVALKVVKSGLDSGQVLRRFEKERQALARLSHSNIAKIFEAGLTPEGRPWFAMELLDGLPIDEYAKTKELTIEERIDLLLQVCHGVGHAHHAGILHRDIKPSNLFVIEEDGRPLIKIIDFGLARVPEDESSSAAQTMTGQWIGTPGYASPEQLSLRPEAVSPRSDIYSIGILAWLLLVGELPEALGSPKGTLAYLEWMQLLEKGEVPRPSTVVSPDEVAKIACLRGGLDWILLKAFSAAPQDRYQTCEQLATDFEAFLRGDPIMARGPDLQDRFSHWVRRHRVLVSLTTLLLFAAATVTILMTLADRPRGLSLADRNLAWAAKSHDRLDRNAALDLDALREEARRRLDSVESQRKVLPRSRRQAGPLEILSLARGEDQTKGESIRSQINPSGRFIVFESASGNLVPGDRNHRKDIFFLDRDMGQLQRVSVGSAGEEANDQSETGTISGDGRWVAFVSDADDLVPEDTNEKADLFLHDRWTGRTSRLPPFSDARLARGRPKWPLFASDADVLVFEQEWEQGPLGAAVVLYDLGTQEYEILSRSMREQSITSGRLPSISDDGRYVAFESISNHLVPGDENGSCDIFLVDRQRQTLRRLNMGAEGQETNSWSEEPVLSGDGRWLAFRSLASNLVPGSSGEYSQLYLLEIGTGRIQLLSRALDGGFANGYCHRASLNRDASVCVFESRASNLVPGDSGNSGLNTDVFYRDLRSQQTFGVSLRGQVDRPESSLRPRIAGQGRWIVFDSKNAGLVPGAIRDRAVVLADAEALPGRSRDERKRPPSADGTAHAQALVFEDERLLAAATALRALLERLR